MEEQCDGHATQYHQQKWHIGTSLHCTQERAYTLKIPAEQIVVASVSIALILVPCTHAFIRNKLFNIFPVQFFTCTNTKKWKKRGGWRMARKAMYNIVESYNKCVCVYVLAV